MWKMDNVQVLTLGTTPQTVMVRGLACLVQNNSESATVYIREKRDDGKAASSSNGWAVGPGKETRIPLVAMELSLVSSASSTDVRVLVLDEE